MPKAAIAEQVKALQPWFHNLHLPDGTQTAPDHFLGDFPRYKWEEISPWLPSELNGIKALDIGCNAGYYSFELAKRGAQVTAIDIDEHYLQQASWAADTLGFSQQIKFRKSTVYDLIGDDEQYDLVWFMGVLYHLRHPLLALDIIRQRCKGRMIFQTMTMPGEEVFPTEQNYTLPQREVMNHPGWPKMAFIEHRVENDPTNWWAPNHAAIEAMLRAAGFSNIKRIGHEIYLCEALDEPSTFAQDELAAFTPKRIIM